MELLQIFTVTFFLAATHFSLTVPCDKNLTVEGSSAAVKVTEGSDVILPCKLQPPCDVSEKVVQWKRGPDIVNTRRKGMDGPDGQNSTFKDRTKLFPEEMNKGNISLKIFNVTKEDEGKYNCSVLSNTIETDIELIVETPQSGNETNEQGPGRLGAGAIAGICIVVVLVIIVMIAAGCWMWRSWKDRGQTQGNSSEDQNNKVEMQQLNRSRDEERNMNPGTFLCGDSED